MLAVLSLTGTAGLAANRKPNGIQAGADASNALLVDYLLQRAKKQRLIAPLEVSCALLMTVTSWSQS